MKVGWLVEQPVMAVSGQVRSSVEFSPAHPLFPANPGVDKFPEALFRVASSAGQCRAGVAASQISQAPHETHWKPARREQD
jgi:hypothetical protein